MPGRGAMTGAALWPARTLWAGVGDAVVWKAGNKKAGVGRLFRDAAGLADQRWRALNRGFDLQITKTLPRRRTILQSRWRLFADLREERTFMAKGLIGREYSRRL